MFRSALTLFVKDKGNERTESERRLKVALTHMKNNGDLHKSLWEWADHLNQLGNEGAHPEDYDDVTAAELRPGQVRAPPHPARVRNAAQLLRNQGLLPDEEIGTPVVLPSASSVDHAP
jgi:hypothetical protein